MRPDSFPQHTEPASPIAIAYHTSQKFMKFILRLINEEYVGFLDPREQYTLAATESETWRVFVLRQEDERVVEARYWEMVEERWFSD